MYNIKFKPNHNEPTISYRVIHCPYIDISECFGHLYNLVPSSKSCLVIHRRPNFLKFICVVGPGFFYHISVPPCDS